VSVQKGEEMAKKDVAPFSISAQPAITKLRRQVKQLNILQQYTKGSDKQQVDSLILALNKSVKMLADNCPNGMTTSVIVDKADLKKILSLG
jgi:hypothetical protein